MSLTLPGAMSLADDLLDLLLFEQSTDDLFAAVDHYSKLVQELNEARDALNEKLKLFYGAGNARFADAATSFRKLQNELGSTLTGNTEKLKFQVDESREKYARAFGAIKVLLERSYGSRPPTAAASGNRVERVKLSEYVKKLDKPKNNEAHESLATNASIFREARHDFFDPALQQLMNFTHETFDWRKESKEDLCALSKDVQSLLSPDHIPENPRDFLADIKLLLNNPFGFAYFKQYLTAEHSEENINFWQAINDYRTSALERLPSRALQIYNTFLSPTAITPLNIGSEAKEEFMRHANEPLSASTFDQMQHAVMDLMEENFFHDFKKTEYANRLVLRLQAYYTDFAEIGSEKKIDGKFFRQLATNDGQREMTRIYCLALRRNGQVWGGTKDGHILVWNAENFKEIHRIEHAHLSPIHAVLEVGEKAIWSAARTIKVWHSDENKMIAREFREIQYGRDIKALFLTSKSVICCSSESMNLTFFDPHNWEVQREFLVPRPDGIPAKITGFIWCVIMHGGYLWLSCHRVILKLDAESLRVVNTMNGHGDLVNCLLGVGTNVWSSSSDQTVRVWNRNGSCLRTIQTSNRVMSMCLVGADVWFGFRDAKIQIWAKDNPQMKKELETKHKDLVSDMIVVANTVWSSSWDRTLCVWN
jgi:WD40 repeat protein